MKIGNLHLVNFGPYEDVEIVFDQPLSIVKADNAAGKSKLAQGVQLPLTGQSFGTDPRGAGAQDKIRLGADKAVLTVALETAKGPMQLVTQYGPGKNPPQKIVAGQGGPDTEPLSKGFAKFLEANGQRLSCCLDAEFFIGLKPADQRDVLAGLMLPTSYSWDEKPEDAAMKALAAKYLPATNWSRPPTIVIDEVYGDAKSGVYSLRTQAKAARDGIYIPAKPTQPEFNANEVQVKLNVLRTNHTKEAKKVKQGGTVQVGRIEQSLTQEQGKLSKAQADRTEARNRQIAIEAQLLDGPTMAAHKQTAAKRRKYDEFGKQIEALDTEIAAQIQAQEIFTELLQDEHGKPVDEAPCPTCTQIIKRSFISKSVSDHKKLQLAAEAEKANLEQRQKDLGDIAGAEAAIKDHEAKVQEKLQAVKDVTAASERIADVEAAVKGLEAALAEAKAAEANPVDTSALDALAAEITVWEGRLTPAVSYESTLKTITEATTRRDSEIAKVAELETLCAFFGPKEGIKSRLIAQHIGAFTETVNSVLTVWGYKANLSIEPYVFEVQTPKTGDKFLPLKELSGFERLAFGVALQSAIAVHSKLRMILVDRADTMVAAQRNRLLGCIKAMLDNGTLEQAIVMIADPSREVPKKAGCQFYFVEGGKIERL